MSLSAIIVMTASIIALWGVATVALSYSLRQEERKLALIQSQGDFEPLSPRAQRDLETWLARHPEEEPAREVRELIELQQQAMQHNPQRFYDWSTIDEARQ